MTLDLTRILEVAIGTLGTTFVAWITLRQTQRNAERSEKRDKVIGEIQVQQIVSDAKVEKIHDGMQAALTAAEKTIAKTEGKDEEKAAQKEQGP